MAPAITTTQGGNFQKTSIKNRIEAKAKSIGDNIAVVHMTANQQQQIVVEVAAESEFQRRLPNIGPQSCD